MLKVETLKTGYCVVILRDQPGLRRVGVDYPMHRVPGGNREDTNPSAGKAYLGTNSSAVCKSGATRCPVWLIPSNSYVHPDGSSRK